MGRESGDQITRSNLEDRARTKNRKISRADRVAIFLYPFIKWRECACMPHHQIVPARPILSPTACPPEEVSKSPRTSSSSCSVLTEVSEDHTPQLGLDREWSERRRQEKSG